MGRGTGRLAGGLLAGALVVALGLAGCSASDSGSKSSAPAAGGPARDDNSVAKPAQGEAQADAGKGAADPGRVLNPGQVPDAAQRSIVYTGTITIQVSDVDDAAGRLSAIATGAGGYVSGDQRSIDAARSSATVAVRVPADKFDSVVGDISRLGKEKRRELSAQDVTTQVVDLDSRVKTQQASVDRVRVLLAKAQTIAEIAAVESELTRREADLESLKAQLAALADQAALSTITVTLLGPEAVTPATPKKKQTGFVHGLSAGWHAFVASVGALLTVLGAVLPFLVAFGIPAWLILSYLRRRSRREALTAGTRTPPAALYPPAPLPAYATATRPTPPAPPATAPTATRPTATPPGAPAPNRTTAAPDPTRGEAEPPQPSK